MVITESIRNAIQAAVTKSGSLLSFSHSVGISHTTVSYWLNGRTRKINSTVWQSLLPMISEYLDPSESISYPCAPVAAGNTAFALREQFAAYGGSRTSAPLLQLADLVEFDPQIDSIEEILREKSKSSVMFTSLVRPGYFAVEIGRNQCGFFPEGTRLLLRWPEAPGDGDTVLAKLREKNGFLFAVYSRKAGEVVLSPLQGCGRKRVIPRADFHNVCSWIVSIREAVQLF